jgi:hypothetical protein
VLDLIEGGRPVVEIAVQLGVSDQAIPKGVTPTRTRAQRLMVAGLHVK